MSRLQLCPNKRTKDDEKNAETKTGSSERRIVSGGKLANTAWTLESSLLRAEREEGGASGQLSLARGCSCGEVRRRATALGGGGGRAGARSTGREGGRRVGRWAQIGPSATRRHAPQTCGASWD